MAMVPIPSEVVEKTWQRVASLAPEHAQKMITCMTKEQPVVLAYLMAVDSDIFNEEERQTLVYLGVVVWQIMLEGSSHLRKVTEKRLRTAETTNLKMAEYLHGETETGFEDTVKKIIGSYGQPEVLRYVIEAIMEETDDAPPIREKNKGIMLLDLKTMIDCFSE